MATAKEQQTLSEFLRVLVTDVASANQVQAPDPATINNQLTNWFASPDFVNATPEQRNAFLTAITSFNKVAKKTRDNSSWFDRTEREFKFAVLDSADAQARVGRDLILNDERRLALRDYHGLSRRLVRGLPDFIQCVTVIQQAAYPILAAFINTWANGRITWANAIIPRAQKQGDDALVILEQYFVDTGLDAGQFPGQWLGVQILTGGINTTGLWVRHDGMAVVQDRVVRKSEYLPIDLWKKNPEGKANLWMPNSDISDPRELVPREVYFTQKCYNVSRKHFVQLRDWSTNNSDREINIYTEFCGFGDVVQSNKDKGPDDFLSERFLLFLFYKMTQACIIMERGTLDNGAVWQNQIVHRDIKPGNIFLGANPTGSFPLPKMADFGLAIETSAADPKNPQNYNGGAGTRIYRPPEQNRSSMASSTPPRADAWEVGNDEQLLAWSNVYGLAMTMYSLVRERNFTTASPFAGTATSRQLRDVKASYYINPLGKQLLILIEACIQKQPVHRIDLRTLEQNLLALIQGDPITRAALEGRTTILGAATNMHGLQTLRNLPTQERYRIGFGHQDLPPAWDPMDVSIDMWGP